MDLLTGIRVILHSERGAWRLRLALAVVSVVAVVTDLSLWCEAD